jgi:hypothetical protein
MIIDEDLRYKIGLALNESTLLGIEFDKEKKFVACSFAVVTMDREGNVPNDNRLLIIFKPVGRFVASLRNGHWDNKDAPIEFFEPTDILAKIQSFNGQSIYGWDFINCGDEDFNKWKDKLSFDYSTGDLIGLTNTIDLFQEGFERHIDIRIWFDDLEILTSKYDKVEINEFIENGKRGWDAIYENNDKMSKFGIIPATDENAEKLKKTVKELTKDEKQSDNWWTKITNRLKK